MRSMAWYGVKHDQVFASDTLEDWLAALIAARACATGIGSDAESPCGERVLARLAAQFL